MQGKKKKNNHLAGYFFFIKRDELIKPQLISQNDVNDSSDLILAAWSSPAFPQQSFHLLQQWMEKGWTFPGSTHPAPSALQKPEEGGMDSPVEAEEFQQPQREANTEMFCCWGRLRSIPQTPLWLFYVCRIIKRNANELQPSGAQAWWGIAHWIIAETEFPRHRHLQSINVFPFFPQFEPTEELFDFSMKDHFCTAIWDKHFSLWQNHPVCSPDRSLSSWGSAAR